MDIDLKAAYVEYNASMHIAGRLPFELFVVAFRIRNDIDIAASEDLKNAMKKHYRLRKTSQRELLVLECIIELYINDIISQSYFEDLYFNKYGKMGPP